MQRHEKICCCWRNVCDSGRKDREENGVGEPEIGSGEGSHNQMVKGRLNCIPQTTVCILPEWGIYQHNR